MMKHDEAFELLAPRSLDALEAHEVVLLDAHVANCPKCQKELDGFLAVAAALGNTVEPLPDGLWSTIATQLGERTKVASRPAPLLVRTNAGASVTPIGPTVSARARRLKAIYGGVLAAAAASILALGMGLANANSHVSQLQGALNVAGDGTVLSALGAPGHKLVTIKTTQDQQVAQFVVLPDGRGYLVSSSLPKLASSLTYQLWGIVKGTAVSVGVLGNAPSHVTFTMAGSPAPTVMAITIQQAGGSPTPSSNLVGSGRV